MIEVKYNHWYPKLLRVNAVTKKECILIASPSEPFDEVLLKHELIHIYQIRKIGYVKWKARYLKEYLAARLKGKSHATAYYQISFEVEAFTKEEEPLTEKEKQELGLEIS